MSSATWITRQDEKKIIKIQKKGKVPHNIEAKPVAQFNEKFEHLAQIRGIPVRIEHGAGGSMVLNVQRHDFVASARAKLKHVHVVLARHLRNGEARRRRRRVREAATLGGGDHRVGRWVRREEGELGGDRGGDSAHGGDDSYRPRVTAARGFWKLCSFGGVGVGAGGVLSYYIFVSNFFEFLSSWER